MMNRLWLATCCGLVLATLSAVWLATAHAQQEAAADDTQQPSQRVVHVVLFKFKESAKPEDIDTIVAGFAALPKKIEGIVDYSWGTNSSPEGLNEGFTHVFIVTFKDAAARDAYLPHPAHQEFVKTLRPHLQQPLVVDFVPQG
jgi:quinol monooxygenase YgiN